LREIEEERSDTSALVIGVYKKLLGKEWDGKIPRISELGNKPSGRSSKQGRT
jgi:hypothetical protein